MILDWAKRPKKDRTLFFPILAFHMSPETLAGAFIFSLISIICRTSPVSWRYLNMRTKLPIGVFACEHVHLVLWNLDRQWILQDLHFLKHISRVGPNHWPLVGGGVVDFDHFVDVVKLVQPADFQDVPVPETAHCWLRQGYIGIGDRLPFFVLQTIF